jgi:hypothetical protein
MIPPMSVLGLDIAAWVFHVGRDDTGAVVLRKHLARRAWRQFMATLPARGYLVRL